MGLAAPVRRFAALVALVLVATSCGASAQLVAPPAEGASSTEGVALAAAVDPTPVPATPTPDAEVAPGPLIPTDTLWQAVDDNFAALDDLDVSYSFLLVSPSEGRIHGRDAKAALLPASNQKVVTAVGALELLDDDARFSTELWLDDDNNVYVVGGADPTFASRHVRAFATALVDELGVPASVTSTVGDVADELAFTEIGDVVVDPSAFPATRVGPGWPARYIPADIGPMSGLWLDDNRHRADRRYLDDPDQGNAELVAEIFADAGITVSGRPRVGSRPETARMLAERRSPTVAALIDDLLARSDNEVGEAMLRHLAAEADLAGEIPEGKALVHDKMAQLGVDLGDPVGDGSGLSRENRLSASQLVRVLETSAGRDWWPVVERGLASAGVNGTLASRLESETTAANVRAKTGTLDDARTLSGTLRTVDDEPLFFAFLVNGEDAPLAVRAMDRIVVAFSSGTLEQLTR